MACDVFPGRYGRAAAVTDASRLGLNALKGREGPVDRLLVDLVAHFAYDELATVIRAVCRG